MSESLAKPIPAQRERRFHTPKAKQVRVIERHMQGESNRQIARKEGLDRGTVSAILSQKEVLIKMAQLQSRALRMADSALDVYESAMASDDRGLAAAAATKLLYGTGVLNKRGLQGTIDDSVNRQVLRKTPVIPEFVQGPRQTQATQEEQPLGTAKVEDSFDPTDVELDTELDRE